MFVPTITRNYKNLFEFHYVSNAIVDLRWSHQYGCHWLHLCIADALSSPSFQISGNHNFLGTVRVQAMDATGAAAV